MSDLSPVLLQKFCQDLPKVELHAHLNGSLSERTLLALQRLKVEEGIEDESNAFLQEFNIDHGDTRTLQDCFEVFRIAHTLVDSPSAVRLATTRTVIEFHRDGCVYLELRSTPRSNQNMSKRDYVEAMIGGIKDAVKSLEEPAITVQLIISIDRRTSYQQACENLDVAVDVMKSNPGHVCAVELSGDPRAGTFAEFIPLFDKARAAGLKVALHMAEVPNPAEISEMLGWRPDRVGHAVCVHPSTGGSQRLWEQFLAAKIPAELCLTSNVKSRSVRQYSSHHFKFLWEAGHPLSLATDDKGVFSTTLSEEYKLCAETFHLSRAQLVDLSESGVDQIFAQEHVKARLRNTFAVFKARIMQTI